LPSTVDLVEQMGGESYVYLTLASGERIVARAPGQSHLQPGEAVVAAVGEGAHLFRRGDDEAAIGHSARIGERVEAPLEH
jgi:multiple sugar transport system ATP-binding protein